MVTWVVASLSCNGKPETAHWSDLKAGCNYIVSQCQKKKERTVVCLHLNSMSLQLLYESETDYSFVKYYNITKVLNDNNSHISSLNPFSFKHTVLCSTFSLGLFGKIISVIIPIRKSLKSSPETHFKWVCLFLCNSTFLGSLFLISNHFCLYKHCNVIYSFVPKKVHFQPHSSNSCA